MRRLNPARLLASALLVSVACDSGAPSADAKAAEAADAKAKEEEELQKRLVERKAKREAKAKAEEEQAKKKEAALDAVAVLPEGKLPKELDKACAAVGEAQMAFFERMFTGESLEKLKSAAGTAIPMTVTTCKKAGSIEVAACQKHALETAPPEMKQELSMILRKCIDKFGNEQPGGVTPPQ